jgi:acid phosphatase (class A)
MYLFIVIPLLLFPAFSQAQEHQNENTQDLTFLYFVPPPPEDSDINFERDVKIYKDAQNMRNSMRWKQAILDADLQNIYTSFVKLLTIQNKIEDKEILSNLIHMIQISVSHAVGPIKAHYKRIRPYDYWSISSCTPEDEYNLRNTSYPSGHAAIAWATALVLSEIFPEQKTEIFNKGYELGQSRIICGIHWQSDVDAGRLIAAEVVAYLHTTEDFKVLISKIIEKMQIQ